MKNRILSILAALIVTTAFVVVFPGQEVFAQESTIKVTVVGTVTADGGQQTPIATATSAIEAVAWPRLKVMA